MASFQPFGGATKWFVALTAAAGLIVVGILNLTDAPIKGDAVPVANNTYSLGSSSSTWSHVYGKFVSSTAGDFTRYVSTTKLVTGLGSATAPSFTFQGDLDTGVYSPGDNNINWTVGGSAVFAMNATNLVAYRPLLPGVNNSYNLGGLANNWKTLFATNVSSTNIDALGYVSTTQLIALNGSVSKPGLVVEGANTGIFSAGDGQVNITSNGVLTASFANGGSSISSNLYAGTNNAKDLGVYGGAWRNITASGTIMTSGDVKARNVTTTGILYTGPITITDPGAPNYWWNAPLSAGTAGTQQEAIASIGDKFIVGWYAEMTGTANVAQNPEVRVYGDLVSYAGNRIHYTSTDALTYTMTSDNFYLAVSTTGAAVTITLPSVTSVKTGTEFKISDRKGNAATNNITVNANGTNTFNLNGTSAKLTKNFSLLYLVSDGVSNWQSVSSTCY